MRLHLFVLSSALVSTVASATFAQNPSPPTKKQADVAPAKQESDATKDEMPEHRNVFSVAGSPILPVGDLSNGFSFGLGGTLGYDRVVHPHVQIIGRTGYSHLFPKSGLDVSLGAVPLWGGARYTFGVNEGGYLEGALGPTILFASATVRVLGNTQSVSDSEVKIGTSLGGGYKFGRLDVGGRFAMWDLGHPGDSATLLATIGYSFASF